MVKYQQVFVLSMLLVSMGIQGKPLYDEEDDLIDLAEMSENMFGNPDSEITGNLVAAQDERSEQNPEELGTYYEGDILIPLRNAEGVNERNGLLALSTRWPGGVIPYEINGQFTKQELDNIQHAFGEYQQDMHTLQATHQ